MSDDNRISRRDWFRLKATQVETPNEAQRHAQAIGERTPGLEPIPHPENHDGMDLSELPPMREALLSPDEVQQLFADIDSLASNILLMQRSTAARRATASRATTHGQLIAARDALLGGDIARVQIRYQWQGDHWIDTLENRDGEYRLVRIAHTTGASPT